MSTSTDSKKVVDSYNSDRVQLQDSITKVYQTANQPTQTSEYQDIQKETSHLSYRQEVIYTTVSAIALVSVLVTLRRMVWR